jgi:hypothetical protein
MESDQLEIARSFQQKENDRFYETNEGGWGEELDEDRQPAQQVFGEERQPKRKRSPESTPKVPTKRRASQEVTAATIAILKAFGPMQAAAGPQAELTKDLSLAREEQKVEHALFASTNDNRPPGVLPGGSWEESAASEGQGEKEREQKKKPRSPSPEFGDKDEVKKCTSCSFSFAGDGSSCTECKQMGNGRVREEDMKSMEQMVALYNALLDRMDQILLLQRRSVAAQDKKIGIYHKQVQELSDGQRKMREEQLEIRAEQKTLKSRSEALMVEVSANKRRHDVKELAVVAQRC